MGLLSMLRGKRPAGDADPVWTPLRPEPELLSGDDADMDDDGQVRLALRAYQVAFGCSHPDGAVITVFTYVSWTEDDQFCLGLRFDYTSEAHADWAYIGYEGDPLDEVFADFDDADAEAAAWAANLAAGHAESMANLPGVFDWDGEPFELPAGEDD